MNLEKAKSVSTGFSSQRCSRTELRSSYRGDSVPTISRRNRSIAHQTFAIPAAAAMNWKAAGESMESKFSREDNGHA